MKRLGIAETTLASGLRIIHLQTGPSCIFEVMVHFPAGSRHERPDQNGMSHLLEHMMFRGSGRYKTSTEFSRQLESISGETNAFTSAEMTEYWFQCDVNKREQCLELLTMFLEEPVFDAFDLEKGIIIKELDEDYNEAGLLIDDHSIAMSAHFGGSGLGLPVGGTGATLAKIQRQDMMDYRKKWYSPDSAVLTIRSGLGHDDVFSSCERHIASWKRRSPDGPQSNTQLGKSTLRKGPQRLGVNNPDNQFSLRYSFATAFNQVDGPFLRALEIANRILDDGMSSRLQRTVREEKGLVYNISGGLSEYADHIVCSIEAIVDAPHLEETARTISAELRDLCSNGPKDDEHQHALKRSLFELVKLEEDHHDYLGRMVEGRFYGREFDPMGEAQSLKSLTNQDIREAAAKIFAPNNLVTVLVGPDAKSTIGNLETL
jgi:predicted Zn-dependent peptidase